MEYDSEYRVQYIPIRLVQVRNMVFVEVPYIITGWLEKNKDPLNETVVNLLGGSKDALVQQLFMPAVSETGKKSKGGSFLTVSFMHRVNKQILNIIDFPS
ncbi:hypothetical protein P879_12019 [Paragonimus westermani]|uniref:Uncharacterized protein n=1 Tax=Paragonimus westermani TaxID=34504 RepID=A0A8T0D676_9TREM|nr:hypothetical protein P879_12019 [Paragonimus westermani]